MTRIAIADDHVLVRRGLAELLREMDDFRVVGEASSGDELLRLLREDRVDVIVMDMNMPGPSGLDLVKSIRAEFPRLPILVLSAHPEDQYAVRVVRAGAMGYLTKESAEADLVVAVRRVASGKRYLTQTLAASLLDALDTNPDEDPHAALSDREYQVLRLIASGMTVGGIAEHLSLSVKTVSTYRSRLLQKMGMSNNSEITRYALENGLVE
ncbi:DNA-binding response regulator [Rubrivirga sp. SAORIC476]|uniref:response regulator n=1 Tax=Rubrivirga sp. SAORIC476 TaxID=1961794 RepID=UPI000BA99EE5|nr:response regulator transcription factor [Rubrivirga sp. SAORIC476]MAQ93566.1 DNA-binding response regulator [Rhodothermaceae bacterium]MAQ95646.1 DNA-binding response regulator [Rhodothermaceae bacterium]MBC12480.1 DNA-binding response regulator [Rhodothermaceae bacterium]PAP79850.1 DNA-binding response regulator [Rubrivirga sp. SAORIC476]